MKWFDARFDASIAATKPVVWTTLTWGLLVFAALLPIGLLSWYAWRLTSHAVRHLVAANNLSAATMTAEWLSRDLEHSINLARAFAALPDMLEAVELRETDAARAEEEVRARLRAVVQAYPRVDRAFVTDPLGVLWSDYPHASESGSVPITGASRSPIQTGRQGRYAPQITFAEDLPRWTTRHVTAGTRNAPCMDVWRPTPSCSFAVGIGRPCVFAVRSALG